MAVMIGAGVYMMRGELSWEDYSIRESFLCCAALVLTIIVHELLHGAAYKLLTGEKLTFGFTLSVAYCGVPHIYVYRRAALIALLTPFTVFTILYIVLLLAVSDPFTKLCILLPFAVHTGGCVGDLYDTYIYLTRFKDPATLMQDTGPKQTFYTRG